MDVNELVVSYLAAWNEPDAKRRREIVTRTWADEGSYIYLGGTDFAIMAKDGRLMSVVGFTDAAPAA